MPSNAELDAKLTELLRVMVSRLPNNKTLPTAVVQQLLCSRYGDTYPEPYVANHATFISDTIKTLMAQKERAVAPAATTTTNGACHEGSEEEDDDDDDSSASDEDDSDEEEEEDEEDDEEDEEASGSEDDDDDSDSQDDESEENHDETEGPEKKRVRGEVVDGIASKEQRASAAGPSTVSVAERCKAMAECLRKLSYRVRAPTAEETLEEYLQQFLIAEFEKHNMDPDKYSKSDIKRYRIKREVDLLQQDGASLTLDRRNRAGRGFGNVAASKEEGDSASQAAPSLSAASARQTSMFLDDD
ncbi:hypothetical protein JKF63_07289 [Porcisia hertigi]|uniref:Uncharacterized protein n=1 Tax=Porcisia hertigi TaxID=2761500 RepID=A0A836LLD2_9TRYP|nr:hypothetical protein JKF63_07289 [Porcisia hertigi]